MCLHFTGHFDFGGHFVTVLPVDLEQQAAAVIIMSPCAHPNMYGLVLICVFVKRQHFVVCHEKSLKLKDSCLKHSVCFFVEVCLKDIMSVADSLYNLQLIREFCRDNLRGCCPLVLEDLLYAPSILRVSNERKVLLL